MAGFVVKSMGLPPYWLAHVKRALRTNIAIWVRGCKMCCSNHGWEVTEHHVDVGRAEALFVHRGLTEACDENWADHCHECRNEELGGELLCCDGCPIAVHLGCVSDGITEFPEGDWFCARCRAPQERKAAIQQSCCCRLHGPLCIVEVGNRMVNLINVEASSLHFETHSEDGHCGLFAVSRWVVETAERVGKSANDGPHRRVGKLVCTTWDRPAQLYY